ncbi:SAM-dependent methyltransferase [Actinoplanes sp. CA-054009]
MRDATKARQQPLKQVIRDLDHPWRESTLRLLVTHRALRFKEIKHQLMATHGKKAPGDGQITKALGGLKRLGYAAKSPRRLDPWVATDLGEWAVSILDTSVLASNADNTVGTSLPTVDPLFSERLRGTRMEELPDIDTTRPHPARRYNYWLGGKDNFEPDRRSAHELEKLFPTVRLAARSNRDMLVRAVRYLATQGGVRQFLDIGPGLPTENNTHQVAQAVAPESRIVYVDNDPMVISHARNRLVSSPEGTTDYILADLRDPGAILGKLEELGTLDLTKPVGLVLVAVLHFIHGDNAAQPIVRTLLDALPPGSFLVATHVTHDFVDEATVQAGRSYVASGISDVWSRSREEFGTLFDGLELVTPGIVQVSEWRSEPGIELPRREDISVWGAVGRKP